MKTLAILALALTPTVAIADDRPRDTHVGVVYIEGVPARNLGEFWDKKLCEFVGKGIVNQAFSDIMRPYQTTPQEALRMMTIEVKCTPVD